MLNTYHSSHVSHLISPIEQEKIYFDVIHYVLKGISTLFFFLCLLEKVALHVVKRQPCDVQLQYILKHRVKSSSPVFGCHTKVSMLIISWKVLIWFQPMLSLCFGLFCIKYIHDERSLLFVALLLWKYLLINQSTNSIPEKSPTWVLASPPTRLSNMLPSWVFDWACLQEQINEGYTFMPGKINDSQKNNWRPSE